MTTTTGTLVQDALFVPAGHTNARPEGPRPGSRADRMLIPVAKDTLRHIAEEVGACVRPLAMRRTDTLTGKTEVLDVPCGARLASKCKPCAERNRRDRIDQIREGWHLADEPIPAPERPSDDVRALLSTRAHLEFDRHEAMTMRIDGPSDEASRKRQAEVAAIDEAIEEIEEQLSGCRIRGTLVGDRDGKQQVTRSTKRRSDVPDLPRVKVSNTTVGRTFAGKGGRVYRPSTLLTITMPGYGEVHTGARYRRGGLKPCSCGALHGQRDPLLGTPINPEEYDYRAAALDAIHFPKVLDRHWQNLRRAVGWKVQYAGAVELQKRLAPHAHFAVRGTMSKEIMRQVAAATYHQVWWPPHTELAYAVDKPPVWDIDAEAYVDPITRKPLPTWDEAIAETLHEDAQPAHVVRIGRIDPRGINHGTKDAERSIRYVTKYLTKDLAEHAPASSDPQRAHLERLHEELSVLPCSPSCANWLLYNVQPDGAKAGLVPGRCKGKVHQRNTLGFTGRRVLISRQWSGKTLTDHRADRREWVKTVLGGALAEEEQPEDTMPSRYTFELAKPSDPDVPAMSIRLLRAVGERQRWKAQLQQLREERSNSANEIHNGEEG